MIFQCVCFTRAIRSLLGQPRTNSWLNDTAGRIFPSKGLDLDAAFSSWSASRWWCTWVSPWNENCLKAHCCAFFSGGANPKPTFWRTKDVLQLLKPWFAVMYVQLAWIWQGLCMIEKLCSTLGWINYTDPEQQLITFSHCYRSKMADSPPPTNEAVRHRTKYPQDNQ